MVMIKVSIAGPRGRMGKEAVTLVKETDHFELVSVIDHKREAAAGVPVYDSLEECFAHEVPDVLIDLTTPEVGYKHTKTALEHGVRPVVGTTGFTAEQLDELKSLAEDKGIGCIIAPNFAIGAVLMMKFSQMASKYFPDIEILELHHDQKLDAPSGTAVKTAEMIREVRQSKEQGHPEEKETLQGARGAEMDGMHIHSVRLPGLVAHQQVMLGGEGELLTIRHDSFHRKSFMSGVKVCVETVMELKTLVYGLENILE
ncbi:4-hydroxy-tetrahydrodipicolinate reductase [Rossellomorea marisflavi]|uniref:4-hydroxy-tetrahydrodipicolinate reductase n=1 Tax=Rossellomorea marisflavi TaxID=189381 RepID=UPI0035159A75